MKLLLYPVNCVCTLLLLWTTACSVQKYVTTQPIRFVIINNTAPDSPYAAYDAQLATIIQSINNENPVFTLHCGNIVHGGTIAMGIHEKDIETQYKQFYRYCSKLNSLLFTACGPLDAYNNSTQLYTRFTQKQAWYSFNYGSHHFIVLYSEDNNVLKLPQQELRWLHDDVKENQHTDKVVFCYFLPAIHKSNSQISVHNDYQHLHTMLKQYNVIAFIGVSGIPSPVTIDTIQYIPVPCDNTFTNKYKKAIRYYIVDFSGNYIKLVPRYL